MSKVTIPSPGEFIPSLDGLRAVAVMIVIAAHFGLDNIVPGGFGVTVFFWISGFLITSQLAGELSRTRVINFSKFYLRRFLRLMPAALFYIVIAGIVFVLIGGSLSFWAWLAAIFYSANYYDLYEGFMSLSPTVFNPMGHLWSLAVEEHFYIIWPIFLVILYKRNLATPLLISICLIVLIWRLYLFGICFRGGFSVAPGGVCGETTFYRLYKATDTRLDSIAWGALIAVLASGKARLHLENILAIRFVQLTAVGLLLIGFLVRNLEFREVFRYSLQGLALSVLLPVICGSKNHLRVILETTPFLYIGRLSYSLYLWHWGAVTLSDWLEPKNGIIWFTVAAGTTIAGACFSYYAIERPMMTFRRRAGSHLAGKSPIVVSP